MQSVWEKKRVFPFAKMDLIDVAIVQACPSHVLSELLHFRVNFKPKILGFPLGGETVGGIV